jgi:hypothetical protein
VNVVVHMHLRSTSESCECDGNISAFSSIVCDNDLGMMDLKAKSTFQLDAKAPRAVF